jgi:hypothetical protein
MLEYPLEIGKILMPAVIPQITVMRVIALIIVIYGINLYII